MLPEKPKKQFFNFLIYFVYFIARHKSLSNHSKYILYSIVCNNSTTNINYKLHDTRYHTYEF